MQMSAGNLHGFFGNLVGIEIGVLHERARRGGGETSAGADGGDRLIGIDYITRPGDQKCLTLVGDDEQRFKVAQHLVGAPVFGELHGRAIEVAGVLLEFCFEAREEIEGVGSRSGKTGEDFLLIKPANFLGRVLEDVVAMVT